MRGNGSDGTGCGGRVERGQQGPVCRRQRWAAMEQILLSVLWRVYLAQLVVLGWGLRRRARRAAFARRRRSARGRECTGRVDGETWPLGSVGARLVGSVQRRRVGEVDGRCGGGLVQDGTVGGGVLLGDAAVLLDGRGL